MKKLIYIAVLTLATAGAQMLPAVALADKPRFSGPDYKGHAQRYEAQRAERQDARPQDRRAQRSRSDQSSRSESSRPESNRSQPTRTESYRGDSRRDQRRAEPRQGQYAQERRDDSRHSNRNTDKLAVVTYETPGYDSFMRDAPRSDRGRYGPSQRDRGGDRPRVSLDQAVSTVRSQYGGKVIRAETRNVDGRSMHYVKILSAEGRVRTVRVDGRTGRIQ